MGHKAKIPTWLVKEVSLSLIMTGLKIFHHLFYLQIKLQLRKLHQQLLKWLQKELKRKQVFLVLITCSLIRKVLTFKNSIVEFGNLDPVIHMIRKWKSLHSLFLDWELESWDSSWIQLNKFLFILRIILLRKSLITVQVLVHGYFIPFMVPFWC